MLKYFLILLSFVSSLLQAQDFKVRYLHPKTGLPAFVYFSDGSVNRPNPENFSSWMQEKFNANSSFRLQYTRSVQGSNGYQHLRYQQYCGPYRVEGGEMVLHQKGNTVVSMNGLYFPSIKPDLQISIAATDAIKIALSSYSDAVFMWEVAHEEKALKAIKNNPNASYYPQTELLIVSTNDSFTANSFRLAYKMDISLYAPFSREAVYIDAQTGAILMKEEQICSIDRTGIAHTKYSGIQTINCDSIADDTFILMDHTRGKGIHTVDVRIVGTDSSREFMDSNNVWNNVNAFKDEVATDAHWSAGKTYDYYKTFYNRLSYDDSDGHIRNNVHFGNKVVNAFWSGNQANFGDGDGINYRPLTSIDIVAHELTHGVTQFSAGLRYKNESGALNESFSDVFAKAIEFYADSANFDWYIAGKISLKNKPFRDFMYPPNQGQPKYYSGKFYSYSVSDNGGVHTNSGVQNFWFYLLCTGGSGYREYDSLTYTVNKIGIEKAARIAYESLNTTLIRESEYIDAAYASIDAAARLYGENSEEYKQVQFAWFAVGVINLNELNTGRNTSAKSAWKLMPNPGSDYLFVHNPLVFETTKVELLDVSGKIVSVQYVHANEAISVATLVSGIYFVRINDTVVLKWMKS